MSGSLHEAELWSFVESKQLGNILSCLFSLFLVCLKSYRTFEDLSNSQVFDKITSNKVISSDETDKPLITTNPYLTGAVWCVQGEKGIQGRPGLAGPAGIGEPGLPVSIKT